MNIFIAEFLGTLILILLGNGVVCNVVLARTKGNGSGWLVIAAGWGVAVFCGACIAAKVSGAHLNTAVTLALAIRGSLEWGLVPVYVLSQLLGAMAGAFLVYVFYRKHFAVEESSDNKLGCFATSPALPGNVQAFLCETIATFVLILTILHFESPSLETTIPAVGERVAGQIEKTQSPIHLGASQLLPVALLVFAIGVSLGGTTGYAINPARDLGPRLVHQLLPIPGKRDSDWGYAWVPILGPLAGGALAAALFGFLSTQ